MIIFKVNLKNHAFFDSLYDLQITDYMTIVKYRKLYKMFDSIAITYS